jgi:hypothetical protein
MVPETCNNKLLAFSLPFCSLERGEGGWGDGGGDDAATTLEVADGDAFFRCDSHVASGNTGMPGQSAEASLPSALLLMTKEQVNGVILTAFGIRTR